MSRTLDIVLVNWNSGNLLRRVLGSIRACSSDRGLLGRLVVVDNASSDGSADVSDLSNDLPLRVLQNNKNRGFGAACNQGAAACHGPYILFLNPDIIVPEGTLSAATQYLADHKLDSVGIVTVRLEDEQGKTQRCTSRFPTAWDILGQAAGLDRVLPRVFKPVFVTNWDHAETREIDQAMGAFLMIHRDLFEELGGFDERFFVYFDDVDLCYRCKALGYKVVHIATVTAMHEGQGTTKRVKDVRLFYHSRSRLLYAGKHFGALGNVATVTATLLIEPIARLVLILARGAQRQDLTALARGYAMLYRSLPRFYQTARRPAD